MRTIGETACTVTHELRSPIFLARTRIAVARRTVAEKWVKVCPGDRARLDSDLQECDAALEDMRNIVSSILDFSRNSQCEDPRKTPASLVVVNVLKLARERLESTEVTLRWRPEPAAMATVFCRLSEMTHVLLNLVHNAIDAVASLPRASENRWVAISVEVVADCVSFHVDDGGEGVASEIESEIMKMGFTTKDRGAGSGVGLAVARSLVERSGGSLVHEIAAVATRFSVHLPSIDDGQN